MVGRVLGEDWGPLGTGGHPTPHVISGKDSATENLEEQRAVAEILRVRGVKSPVLYLSS